MARELRRREFTSIVYGSSFYGGGGGGCSEEGLALIEAMYQEDADASLKMIDISEMEDDAGIVSTMVAALGSPAATKGKTFQKESVNAVKGMCEQARFEGKQLCIFRRDGRRQYHASAVCGMEMRPSGS